MIIKQYLLSLACFVVAILIEWQNIVLSQLPNHIQFPHSPNPNKTPQNPSELKSGRIFAALC
jgi:hypothetical protein